jgi:hypothetical protein
LTIRNAAFQRLEISGCTFKKEVTFVGSTLNRPMIADSQFEGALKFRSCELKDMQFRKNAVRGRFDWANSTTKGRHDVAKCTFGGVVSAWETRFTGWGNFTHCTFEDDGDFRSFHAEQGVSITRCVFKKDALFRGAAVAKKFDLSESVFHGVLDLSKAKLQDFAYLQDIRLEPSAKLAFVNAVAERILIRPNQIEGRLKSETAGDYETAMQEYGLLKACYQKLYRFDEEDWAFYNFKVCQRRKKPIAGRPWSAAGRFLDWLLLDRGCGYGTKPFRAVWAAAIIIVAFAAIYAVGIHNFDVERPPIADQPIGYWLNRVLFSTTTAVAVFTSGFGGDQLTQAHGWVLVPLMAEAVLGTFLWGLFIVAFSRKVIR